jgi:transglutaminase-like putative cysteine protease
LPQERAAMLIHIGFEIAFDVPGPVPMLLMLYAHPEYAPLLKQPEWVRIEPAIDVNSFIDGFGNRAAHILAPAGRLVMSYDNVIQDSGTPEATIDGARLHPAGELPPGCMPFLLSSRYCEVDRMSELAWDMFGKTPATWERVRAVVDYVHNHITFGYEYARPTKTAYDAWLEKRGVCRDYAHLTVTLLRALNIPARYATGYLGDIGVPPDPLPMDFSAYCEVYLGHKWYTLDPRHNVPRIGRVPQARGRDAVDVALTTSFGPAQLVKFNVWTEEVQDA